MTQQIPEYERALSKRLSYILDNVGCSREDRDRKVKFATETEVSMSLAHTFQKSGLTSYIFGSRGEGSTGPGLHSDLDIVFQSEMTKVVTDIRDFQSDKRNYLMVKDAFTHPGYVKLQFIGLSSDYNPVPIHHLEFYPPLTLDAFNRSVLLNTVYSYIGLPMSGPALQICALLKMDCVDHVMAFNCSKWPHDEYKWFQRPRVHGWPTPEQIKSAWRYGCFVTPVGHPHSLEQNIEWRLSFSKIERELVRSFEDTTMKVYLLLKMIKKTYIEPVVGDAFSSYQCKVCMLWMREETPCHLWRDENLIYCLILCIRKLNEWATAGFCPDYFIDTNNIFDRKIFGNEQSKLVQILNYLLSTECRFLIGIQCMDLGVQLAGGIIRSVLHHSANLAIIAFDEHYYHELNIKNLISARKSILVHIPQYYPTLVEYLVFFVYASKVSPYIMQYPLKHVMMVLWSQLGFHIASVCLNSARFLSREQKDFLISLASRCISLGINIDATSVRLKLCGLGMELGYYDSTEVYLQHIKDHWIQYMYSGTLGLDGMVTVLNCNVVSFLEKVSTNIYSTEKLMQNQVSISVVYMPSEIPITPIPLRMEMFKSAGVPADKRIELNRVCCNWAIVDSLMCLYFFQYLNFCRQGKERDKQVAIDNMIHVIMSEPNMQHRDTAFNLLGYSFLHENQIDNAFICFAQSLKICAYHNAAKFHLGVLFKRAHITHRRRVHCGNGLTRIES